jgi:hypothetical protein
MESKDPIELLVDYDRGWRSYVGCPATAFQLKMWAEALSLGEDIRLVNPAGPPPTTYGEMKQALDDFKRSTTNLVAMLSQTVSYLTR